MAVVNFVVLIVVAMLLALSQVLLVNKVFEIWENVTEHLLVCFCNDNID